MRLQELVEVLPHTRNPVDDALHAVGVLVVSMTTVAMATPNVGVDEAAPKVSGEEPENWFDVIGAEHPAEIVVQLEVGRGACRRGLVHGADDVRTAEQDTRYNNVELLSIYSYQV